MGWALEDLPDFNFLLVYSTAYLDDMVGFFEGHPWSNQAVRQCVKKHIAVRSRFHWRLNVLPNFSFDCFLHTPCFVRFALAANGCLAIDFVSECTQRVRYLAACARISFYKLRGFVATDVDAQ